MTLRSLVLAALALSALGCDSGGPAEEPVQPAIVGTWALQSATLDTYATVSQTQTALDLFTPASGALTVEGAVSASVRYLDQRYSNSFGDGTLTGYSLSSVPESTAGVTSIRFAVTPSGDAVVSVHGGDGEARQSFYLEGGQNPDLFSLGADTVQVSRARYVDSLGEAVFVEGVLVLARRRVEAGREYLLSRRALNGYLGNGASRTFSSDGTYEEQNGLYGANSGTWESNGDSTVVVKIGGASTEYRYELAGGALTLTSSREPCDATCRFDVRRYFDLIEGTIEAGRLENVFGLTRSLP